MIYTVNNQSAILEIPKHVKRIGVSMSGGADSAILCYLLAKQIKEHDLNIKLHPISAIFAVRPWSYDHARLAIGVIKKELQINDIFGQHYKFDINLKECPSDEEKEKHFDHVISFLIMNEMIDHLYSGKTKNPSHEIMSKFYDQQPQIDRNNPTEKNVYKDGIETVPWAMVDKAFTIGLYKQYNLLNTLLPVTRSCEGDKVITNNFTKECGKCWWCEERNWALQSIHE